MKILLSQDQRLSIAPITTPVTKFSNLKTKKEMVNARKSKKVRQAEK